MGGELHHAEPRRPPARTRGHDIRVATTAEEVEALRQVWGAFDWPDVDAQLDFFLATLKTRSDLLRPHAVVVSRGGVPEAMLLARVERVRALPAVRPLHVVRPAITAVVVPGGLQGTPEAQAVAARALYRLTRRGRVRGITFRDCRPDGPERALIRQVVPAPLRGASLASARRWFTDLPDGYEAYLAGLSRNLRRARRREATAIERRFGERLELVRHASPRDAEALLADVEHVAARSHQRDLGVGFHRSKLEPLVRAALAHGLARAWVLRLDGRPVAYELGWLHGKTYRGAFIGYDPDFAEHAVGGYVEQAVLRDLCDDPTVRVYDHGTGDYPYKERLSNRSEPRADLWAFQASPAGMTLHVLRSAYEAARWAGRRRGDKG